jgi:hypothetical protein
MTAGAGGGVLGSSLYRISGLARDGGQILPWTLVLKVLHEKPDSRPADSHYWRREAEVYQSGVFDTMPPCLGAPRCFGVTDYAGDSCWLWLEDVKDEVELWPIERYGSAARHLGQFNAAYLTGRPLPAWPWLSGDWIRDDTSAFGAKLDRFRQNLEHPLMRRFVSADAASRLVQLWEERERFLSALGALPRTLCHFDAFRRNMLTRRIADQDQTVLIDWAFLGPGPVGAEIVSLVMVTLVFGHVSTSQAAMLDRAAFDGYVAGLREAGWRGDAQQVRLGYTAAMAVRRMAMIGYFLTTVIDEKQHALVEEIGGLPIGEWGDRVSRIGEFVDGLTSEARELMRGVA